MVLRDSAALLNVHLAYVNKQTLPTQKFDKCGTDCIMTLVAAYNDEKELASEQTYIMLKSRTIQNEDEPIWNVSDLG